MTFRLYPDGNGDTIKLFDDDGLMMPTPCLNWHDMNKLTSREDDVMICVYPKSGTHWIWEVVHMLVTGSTELTSLDMKSHLLYLADTDYLEKMESPRVLATHRHFHDLPTDFIQKRRKLVLMVRDPKDVCVSCYDFIKSIKPAEYSGQFDGFLQLFLQGKVSGNTWSRWVSSYEKGLKEHPEIPYHVVHYEQLVQDPEKSIGDLADFLHCGSGSVSPAAEKTRFSNMKRTKSSTDDPFSFFFKDNNSYDHVYRKGESGGWRDWFSDQQASHFDECLRKQLGRRDITPQF